MSPPLTPSDLQDMKVHLEQSGQYKVLSKALFQKQYKAVPEGTVLRKACVLDVESTGLDSNQHEMINLAIIQFQYDSDGVIYNVSQFANEFQQPVNPIPPEITEINSITNEQVAGKSFDVKRIERCLTDSDLIISHNAKFDRAFVVKTFPMTETIVWGCTLTQLDWKDLFNIKHKNLEAIGFRLGFYYDAHLALPDCLALMKVLTTEKDGKTLFSYLLDASNRQSTLVEACGSPFTKNDLLKAQGFSFNSDKKSWTKLSPSEDVDTLTNFLKREIYSPGAYKAKVTPMDRLDLFK